MAARELVVVVLNHTNEELSLEPGSARLALGEWTAGTPESQPPAGIRAGESAMWRCRSRRLGAGTAGSVAYRIVGYGAQSRVSFSWDVHYLTPSRFAHACDSDEFAVRALGGSGRQAVAVFVFGECVPFQPCRVVWLRRVS